MLVRAGRRNTLVPWGDAGPAAAASTARKWSDMAGHGRTRSDMVEATVHPPARAGLRRCGFEQYEPNPIDLRR